MKQKIGMIIAPLLTGIILLVLTVGKIIKFFQRRKHSKKGDVDEIST